MEQWKRVVPPSLMKHPRILLTAEMDPEVNKIRDLFKVKLYTIRSKTKKKRKKKRKKERERERKKEREKKKRERERE